MNHINFTNRDIDVIAMALIDNAVIGHLNKLEYNLAYDILERLYEPVTLSKDDLTLICNSLRRYALKYEYELLEVAECERVYNFILKEFRHE